MNGDRNQDEAEAKFGHILSDLGRVTLNDLLDDLLIPPHFLPSTRTPSSARIFVITDDRHKILAIDRLKDTRWPWTAS